MATFLLYWIIGAFIATLVIPFLEILVVLSRGPEFVVWVRKGMQEMRQKRERISPTTFAVLVLIFWPLLVISWMRAAWNRQTLIERRINAFRAEADLKERRERNLARGHRQIRNVRGHQFMWVPLDTSQVTNDKGQVPYIYIRTIPYGSGVSTTHMVVECEDRFEAARICDPKSKDTFDLPKSPDFRAESLAEIMNQCDNDVAWNDLCVPGRDRARTLWRRGFKV